MSKINLNKGYDYSKVPCILQTPRGVQHMPNDTVKAEDCIVVAQQWCPTGYSIYNAGEYLGIKCYRSADTQAFSRVGNYNHVDQSKRTLGTSGYVAWRGEEYPGIDDIEMRIYPDLSCVIVNAKRFGLPGEEKTRYYVVTDGSYSMCCYWALLNKTTGQPMPEREHIIHFVESEEEIRACATMLPDNKKGTLLNSMNYLSASDLSRRMIYADTLGSRNPSFAPETRKVVESFFKVRDPENDKRRSLFCRRNHLVCSADGVVLNSLKDIFVWISLKVPAETGKKTAGAENKEEHAIRLTKLFSKEWNDPDNSKYEYTRLWAREGDEIVLVLPSRDNGHSYWYEGCNGKKKVFSFNVKTRKRFMAEYDYAGWTFPIPSMNYVAKYLALSNLDGHGRSKNTTIIKDGLTARELFDKTNVAWIMDNVGNEVQTFPVAGTSMLREKLGSVKEMLEDPNIGTLALQILVSTGIPAMEQLLKSKMFNLYFCMLEDMLSREEHFADKSKKSQQYNGYSNISYFGKEKNLKKMFGMRLDQMRMIDKYSMLYNRYDSPRYARYHREAKYYERNIPKLNGVSKVLGVHLCDVDNETFDRVLRLATGDYAVNWNDIGDLIIAALGNQEGTGNGAKVKQIVNLIEAYTDTAEDIADRSSYSWYNEGLQIYRDYLRSRASLKQMQAANPALKDVFSEKRYPIKPGKAKRFIPFVMGMRDPRYSWRSGVDNEERFLKCYRDHYPLAEKRGDLQVVKGPTEDGEGTRVTGVLINMTPKENVRFLHDDAAFWVGFHKDEGQNALFKEAVKRVQPLEWEDPKSGLKIVAPRCVQELKDEGHVLSHCVGGYVDAIIGGQDNIMFIRRSDMPEHPFFTLEIVRDGEVRQVHCYQNLNPTEEDISRAYERSGYEVYNKKFDVQGFLKRWAAAMKGKVDARSIQPRYRALCALR